MAKLNKTVALGMLLLFMAATARATVQVENVDLNTAPLWTQTSIGVDVNLGSDESLSVIVQIYDNNIFRAEEERTLESLDGNTYYYQFNFTLQFTEGYHSVDANILDANYNEIAWGHTSAEVLANPLIFDDTNLSWTLIQQYVLPIAQSLSICLVEKVDLNFSLTQTLGTMKALENDVGIAEADKIEAENKLVEKRTELDSCNSAWATCKADKSTVESNLLNSESKCTNEKAILKNEEIDSCNYLLDLKEETVEQRDTRILELTGTKLEFEYLGAAGWIAFFMVCGLIGFMYYNNRIR